MIERDELERISRLNHIAPYQQEKHYIQNIILWSIANESANELVFKGGTALWFFYGLNRFSEELDFTALEDVKYKHLMEAAREQLRFRNIGTSVKNLESARGFSFRLGAEGPLFSEEKHRCFVRVEISERRDLLCKPQLKTYVPPYNELSPFSINVMDPKEVLAEKIRAILSRDKTRDIYDLWFILGKETEIDYDLIAKKTEGQFSKSVLINRIIRVEKTWKTDLEWMIFGPVPRFSQIKKEIEEKLV